MFPSDFLKFSPHISDIQQVSSDHRMKSTTMSCQTERYFIGKSDTSDSFQELCSLNIYNGIIFPSLHPARILQFISRWTESTKRLAIGPNHMRRLQWLIHQMKLSARHTVGILNLKLFSENFRKSTCWKHCKYKEWASVFLGSWGMNRITEQTNHPKTASRFTQFVCPALQFMPYEPRKKTLIP